MIQIKSLENTTFDQLYEAFSNAFAEYEVQQTADQLNVMLQRRGFKPELSLGAFDEGRLVSFTCNGIGKFKGTETAYDTGTGTLKEYRGKGLAGQIFQYSLPFLRQAGVKQYLLEVLKHNNSAISVYRKQGFEIVREFSYFTVERINISSRKRQKGNDISITTADLNTINRMNSWFDFEPSWQNSFESVGRQVEGFVIKAANVDNSPVGYCIFEPLSGDITQIVVQSQYRRKGIATALLDEVLMDCKSMGVKLINTDNQYPAINEWAVSVRLIKRGEQFEMMLKL